MSAHWLCALFKGYRIITNITSNMGLTVQNLMWLLQLETQFLISFISSFISVFLFSLHHIEVQLHSYTSFKRKFFMPLK